ncbi:hypothetical protein Y886_11375 [Xanthomonas hyacinthi DSM 19077]|nr:hypothetical protein Y886_11375 [Xanthomonas hyacinthi DSM 19077]
MWHFRLIVPKALRPILGLGVVKRSLGTKDPALARMWAYALGVRCAQMLATARDELEAGMSKQWDDDAVARMMGQIEKNLDGGTVRKWEVETPDGHRLRTDGSDRDHRQGMEALKAILEAQPPVTMSPRYPVAPAASGSRLNLGDAIKGYSEVEALAMRPNTWSQRKRALDDFCKAIGPFAFVALITRQKASTWSDGLLRSGKSNVYVANCVSHVAQLFESLLRKEIVTSNPIKGLVVVKKSEKAKRRAQGHEWEPFEVETLKRIFDPANLKKVKEHVSWGALLGLYTGGRVGELAQIFLRDFVVEGGVPCLKICADSDGQSIKTGFGGERLVPIHPDLIELGLLDRVERLRAEGHERLFPRMRIDSAAGKGNSISKGFNYYLAGLGIKPRRAHGIIGIHSLRKTVIQTLQGSSLPAERRRALVGHEAGDPVADTHQGSYMRTWTPGELSAFFPGLPWASWLRLTDLAPMLRGQKPREF